jgi:hypothetical protein
MIVLAAREGRNPAARATFGNVRRWRGGVVERSDDDRASSRQNAARIHAPFARSREVAHVAVLAVFQPRGEPIGGGGEPRGSEADAIETFVEDERPQLLSGGIPEHLACSQRHGRLILPRLFRAYNRTRRGLPPSGRMDQRLGRCPGVRAPETGPASWRTPR